MTTTETPNRLAVYDQAATAVQAERLYPYGPPPKGVDPERWVELTDALEDSRYVQGLPALVPWQIRTLAGFLADRILVEGGSR